VHACLMRPRAPPTPPRRPGSFRNIELTPYRNAPMVPCMSKKEKLLLCNAYPELANQLVDQDLREVLLSGSARSAEWRCTQGHTWSTSVVTRTSGAACPYCTNHFVLEGYNDLATTHPQLASELEDTSLANTVVAGSEKVLRWRCTIGHVWATRVNTRVAGGGCPFCSNRLVLPGWNDLATTHPEHADCLVVAEEASRYSAGSTKNLTWHCARGHEYTARVYKQVRTATPCPYCGNRKTLAGWNDLATTHPELAAELVDQSLATQVTAGTHKALLWRCAQGHEPFRATVGDRARKQSKCSACARYGFNESAPAWLYLVRNAEHDLLKIGITNNLSSRLRQHARLGFTPLETDGPYTDGRAARMVERTILTGLREQEAVFYESLGLPRFNGHTETWLRTSHRARSLRTLKKLTAQRG
jgi:uncharacterized Zn-finger protein